MSRFGADLINASIHCQLLLTVTPKGFRIELSALNRDINNLSMILPNDSFDEALELFWKSARAVVMDQLLKRD